MSGIKIPIGGDISPFLAITAELKAEMRKLSQGVKVPMKAIKEESSSAFSGLAAAGAGAAAAVAGVVAAAGAAIGAGIGFGVSKAIKEAANLETLSTAFVPLLGSADAAQARIAELAKFAAETPFEMPEVARASKVLEVLTNGALSTGNGLTMVGDVAAATGQPFEELAMWIGRLYDGIQSGRPVGEALMRLQELGVVSGTTRGELEDLQKSGVRGAQVWGVVERSLGRFSGSMELQSGTWNGLLSSLKDNITQTFAAFGQPILDAIRPYLADVADMTGKLVAKAAEFGKKVGDIINFVKASFAMGNFSSLVSASLKLGFAQAVNFLYAAMTASFGAAGQSLVEAFEIVVTGLVQLTKPEFWSGLKNTLLGIVFTLLATLQRNLASLLEMVKPIAEVFGEGESITAAQENLRQQDEDLRGYAGEYFAAAGADLKPIFADMGRQLAESGAAIANRWQEVFSSSKDVIATGGMKEDLRKLILETRDFAAKTASGQNSAPVADKPDRRPSIVWTKVFSDTTSLGKVGGGGGFSFLQPMISESRKANNILSRIEQNTRKTAEPARSIV